MEPAVETASTGTALDTPLASAHTHAGARMGVWFGCALPDTFGDAAAEFLQARDAVALIDKNYRAYLSFTGPDRVLSERRPDERHQEPVRWSRKCLAAFESAGTHSRRD